jgi:hypothetical protein
MPPLWNKQRPFVPVTQSLSFEQPKHAGEPSGQVVPRGTLVLRSSGHVKAAGRWFAGTCAILGVAPEQETVTTSTPHRKRDNDVSDRSPLTSKS